MGIAVEFTPDMALRNINEFKEGRRREEECIPENLEKDRVYDFLKSEQRHYCMVAESPLVETKGKGELSRPLAAVRILEATHFFDENNKVWNRGKYKVIDVFNDDKCHFDNYSLIK